MLELLLELIGLVVVTAFSLLVVLMFALRRTKKPFLITEGDGVASDDRMVYVHSFPRESTRQVVNLSPFCVKLETWLRVHNIPYKFVGTYQTSRTVEASGQKPFIMIGGKQVADSARCIRHLATLFKVDENLSTSDSVLSSCLISHIENRFSWTYLYYRYVDHYREYKSVHRLPRKSSFLNDVARQLIRLGVKLQAHGAGVSRRPLLDIYKLGIKDIDTFNNALGDKQYLLGDEITEVDCALFGQLSQVVYVKEMNYPHTKAFEQYPNLVDYMQRIKTRYWPDWDEITSNEPFKY